MKKLLLLSLMFSSCSKEMQRSGNNQPGNDRSVKGKKGKPIPESVIWLDFRKSGYTVEQILACSTLVAEDFADYNVTITTDSIVYATKDRYHRNYCKIAIGSGGSFAIGRSYMHGDGWCQVDPSYYYNWGPTEKVMANHIAHELGHTYGLEHQCWWDGCIFVFEYRPGTLMGSASDSSNLTWTTGPTKLGCTYIQNDRDTLAKYIGIKR